jgi:hypothetical protein
LNVDVKRKVTGSVAGELIIGLGDFNSARCKLQNSDL